MKKNLIFYAYYDSSSTNDYFYYHLNLLNEYKDVFDGVKVIYIATDVPEIKSQFDFLNPDILRVVENDPENRESRYFIDQLSDLNSLDFKDSITFYGHSKGTTYDQNINLLKWVVSMYFFNLESDNLHKVESDLKADKSFSGIFRIDFPCPPWVNVKWHYSGTFFWFNTEKIFNKKDWDKHYIDRFSTESYAGSKFTINESALSEDLFNDYTNSFLQYPYNRFDLRYDGYWSLFENIVDHNKLQKFKKLINDVLIKDMTKSKSK